MNNIIKIAVESLGLDPEQTMIKKAETMGVSEDEILDGLSKIHFLKIKGFDPQHAQTITMLACMYQSQKSQGMVRPPTAFRMALSILSSYIATRGEQW